MSFEGFSAGGTIFAINAKNRWHPQHNVPYTWFESGLWRVTGVEPTKMDIEPIETYVHYERLDLEVDVGTVGEEVALGLVRSALRESGQKYKKVP